MIKKFYITKIAKLICLIIAIELLTPSVVMAGSVEGQNGTGVPTGSTSGGTSSGGSGKSSCCKFTSSLVGHHCTLAGSELFYESFRMEYDVFDGKNNLFSLENINSLAGTALGIDLRENRQIWWYVYGYRTDIYSNNCYHGVEHPGEEICPTDGSNSTCTYTPSTYTCEPGTSWLSEAAVPDDSCIKSYVPATKTRATNKAMGKETYVLHLPDPNDANCNIFDDSRSLSTECQQKLNRELISRTAVVKRDDKPTYLDCTDKESKNVSNCRGAYGSSKEYGSLISPWTRIGGVLVNFHYQNNKACLNVKTAEVRYVSTKSEKCTSEEIEIANDETQGKIHSHFFVPLNTKESNDLMIIMEPNKNDPYNKKSAGLCINIIENYKDYTSYIIPTQDIKRGFSGIPSQDKATIKKNNGCYFMTIIDIPVTQRFYHEEENSDKTSILNGFNFYYRPIDTSNPFPNGLRQDSNWEEWESDGSNDPDLSKSFNTVTYTTNIDLYEIRNYKNEILTEDNTTNVYTSWSKMNLDGSSQIINKGTTIIRSPLISKNSFYSLGCGILNECEYLDGNHKTKNPLFNKECSKVRNGDVCP